MRSLLILTGLLLTVASLCGCGGADSKFVGSWLATGVDLKPKYASIPFIADTAKQKVGVMRLELKPDRNFSMSNESGIWSIDGEKLHLKVTNVGQQSLDEAKAALKEKVAQFPEIVSLVDDQLQENNEGSIGPDHKTLTLGLGFGTVKFKKVEG